MAMTLYCRECQQPNYFERNWLNEDDACQYCHSVGQWRTLNDPKHDYTLTHNDKRFLRSLRIGQE